MKLWWYGIARSFRWISFASALFDTVVDGAGLSHSLQALAWGRPLGKFIENHLNGFQV
jgi:hypothetical protein